MSKKTSFILLDEGADWEGDSQVIAHWTQLNVSEPHISLPQKTADQAENIKEEYLAWVHDLGRLKVGGKSLIKALKILNNLSYWWMTSIAIKSPFNNDSLYIVFKLRVLERLYLKEKCNGLFYCGNNSILHQILQSWCKNLGHPYKQIHTKTNILVKEKGVRKWLRKFPGWVQALAFLLKHGFLRYRHIKSMNLDRVEQIKQEGGVTIVSYFPNFDLEKTKKGEYWSRYWESLHLLLDELPFKINWVWYYFEGSGFKFEEMVSLRETCNKKNSKKNHFFILEEFLNLGAFLNAIKLYLKIYSQGLRFNEIRKEFRFPGSSLNFFPAMKKEWQASFFGNVAIEGALRIVMFDSMAKTIPASPWGLFVWENLSMDFALMSAWRRHQKETKILASQHGFFRPFDLRLYSDSRDFNEKGGEAIPLPDKLCANNIEAISLLQKVGFPQKKIAKTEALRYFNLKDRYWIYKKPIPPDRRVLLVIMGITNRENRFQFQLLKEAEEIGGLQNYSQVWIKPHPARSSDGLKPLYESKIESILKDQPLSDLWPEVDVVYGAHSTGASWEASWYGIPAIAVGALNSLELNPLTGLPGFRFVTNGYELYDQLKNPQLAKIPEDYFFLDKDLGFWRELLKG